MAVILSQVDVGSYVCIFQPSNRLKICYKVSQSLLSGHKAVFFLPDAPSNPRKLKATAVTKDSVMLTWESPKSDGGCPISKYSIEKCVCSTGEYVRGAEVVGNSYSVKLDKLLPSTEYQFRVFAYNPAGASESPAVLKSPVTTKGGIGKFACFEMYLFDLSGL